jgi:hypothetical protein
MGIVFVVLLYSQLMDQLASNKSIPVIPMVVMGGAYVLPGVFLAWSGPAMKAGAVSGAVVAVLMAIWLSATTAVAIVANILAANAADRNVSDWVVPQCVGNGALLAAALVLSVQAVRMLVSRRAG